MMFMHVTRLSTGAAARGAGGAAGCGGMCLCVLGCLRRVCVCLLTAWSVLTSWSLATLSFMRTNLRVLAGGKRAPEVSAARQPSAIARRKPRGLCPCHEGALGCAFGPVDTTLSGHGLISQRPGIRGIHVGSHGSHSQSQERHEWLERVRTLQAEDLYSRRKRVAAEASLNRRMAMAAMASPTLADPVESA